MLDSTAAPQRPSYEKTAHEAISHITAMQQTRTNACQIYLVISHPNHTAESEIADFEANVGRIHNVFIERAAGRSGAYNILIAPRKPR